MTNNKQGNYYNQTDENLIQDFLAKYLPYWPLFIFFLLISGTAGWLYLRYKVPSYEIAASIIVKDQKKGLDESKVLDALDLFGDKKIVENETEVMHSHTIIKQVVKNLHLYATVMEDGKITQKSAYISSPIIVESSNPDSLDNYLPRDPNWPNKIYFSFNRVQNKIVIGNKHYEINKFVTTPFGDLKFVPNPLYQSSNSNRQLFFSLISVKKIANKIIEGLKIAATSKQSSVITLIINDEVPRRGEDILNELMKVYNNADVKEKNKQAANTLTFVEDRLKYVVKELDSVESQLQLYKTKNKIVDISAQGQAFLQAVGNNDVKLGDMSMQLAVLDQVENYVQDKNNQGSIVPSTLGVTDPVLGQLLDKLYGTELEYEKLKKVTAENNPIMISMVDQISKLKPSILENIRNQRKSLSAGKNDIASTNGKYASMLQTMPAKEKGLLEISRQQAIKNSIYTFLLQKREEAALSNASAVADSQLVDAGESSEKPVSPKKLIVCLVALIVGLGAGFAIVSVREVMNRTILFRTEIEKFTTTPILGEVLYDQNKNQLVITEGKRTYIAEQFRHLRTSLGYLGINSRKKKILITSSISGEGKSFIVANLGVSLALMGKKVVMLELDLRKPKLSRIFNLQSQAGITTYLISDLEPISIIKESGVNANLFIIPSGPIPPNPSELILNGKLQELLNYLETQFDYILIDTAPVSPVTDAYILSPICDATLYIVRHGYTPKGFIQRLDEQNKLKGLKNMAIIFNGIKGRGFAKYGYGYGYGYGYTKEYGSESKKIRKQEKTI